MHKKYVYKYIEQVEDSYWAKSWTNTHTAPGEKKNGYDRKQPKILPSLSKAPPSDNYGTILLLNIEIVVGNSV